MILVLNAYDIIPGKEALYAEYSAKASKHIQNLDVEVVAAGHNPVRELAGQSRNHFVLVRFPDIDAFDALMAALSGDDLHKLREEATKNYIWTAYEPWSFG